MECKIIANGDLPVAGVEVLGYSKEWIDEDYNQDGIRICYMVDLTDEDGLYIWSSAIWCGYHDEWHTVSSDDEMEERKLNHSKPTHWIEKPETPN